MHINVQPRPHEILDKGYEREEYPTPITNFPWSVAMKKTLLTVSIVLAQMLAVSAFAQTKGEADPAQSKAAPAAPATATEKAQAKATRKAEGAKVSKGAKADQGPESTGVAKVASKEEKAAAKAKRKAATKEAVKKGQTTSGEK
jgi:hypothetical protein